ncbi:MAG: exodeoxyribonuclease V subunit gamma [Firmicutes bacterium]|nr:exodeoxyribonuclease V subunit gamma [Bacillota bacterium]
MSLQIIYGRAGSGKTNACFDVIKKHSARETLFIVPEQISLITEKEITKRFSQSKVEVLSFERLAQRVFSTVGPVGIQYVDSSANYMLIQQLLFELNKKFTYLTGACETEDFGSVIAETINELKRCNITPEIVTGLVDMLDGPIKLKMSDIALIYAQYNKLLEHPLSNEEDALPTALEKIVEHNLYSGINVVIHSFNSFSPVQFLVIEEFLRRADTVTLSLCTDSVFPPDDISDVFYSAKKSANKLFDIARNNNVSVLPNIYTDNFKKYENNSELLFLEKTYFNYSSDKFEDNVQNVAIFSADNHFGEVEAAAQNILRLCREKKYRFKDIAVITKAMDVYAPLIRNMFEDFEILYHIDEKQNTMQHPFTRAVLSALDIIIHNFEYEPVFTWLKSEYSNAKEGDVFLLENYVLACGVTSAMWKNDKEWTFLPYGFDETDLEQINNIRKTVIADIVAFESKFSGRKTVYEISSAFIDFLYQSGAEKTVREKIAQYRKDGLIEKSNSLSMVWNAIISTIDSFTLSFKDKYITFEKYRSIFITGLKGYKINEIPPTVDEVLICDVNRFYNRDKKCVFILGVSNGVFPASYKNEGFLSDNDRQQLADVKVELGDNTKIKQAGESYSIYSALTSPVEKLFLFYPSANNEGEALYPSTVIDRVKNLFPKLKEQSNLYKSSDIMPSVEGTLPSFNKMLTDIIRFSEVKAWFEKNQSQRLSHALTALSYTNMPAPLSPKAVSTLFGNMPSASISRAEQYNGCAFAYYLKYGLSAKVREKHVIEPAQTGSFMHEIIEQYSNFAQEVGWDNVSPNELEQKISEITENVFKKYLSEIYTSSPRFNYLSKKIKNIMSTTAKSISEFYKSSPFVPLGYEVAFGEGGNFPPITLDVDGVSVKLRGKVDRVDIWRTKSGNYINVVDYKSSGKDIDYSQVLCGIQIQLPTYIKAVCETLSQREGVVSVPAAMLYYKFDSPLITANKNITDEQIWQGVQKNLRMKGLTLERDEIAEGINTVYAVKSTATGKNIDTICSVAHKKLLAAFKGILKGNISLNPVRVSGYTACDYCPYRPICRFDTSLGGNKYKSFKKLSKEEFFNHVDKMDG